MSSSTQPYPALVLIQVIITRYAYPVVLSIGIVGNFLNIILFLRKSLRTTSCNNYFFASAFSNLVALNIGIVAMLYTYDRPWAITTAYCKIRSYMFNASQQISRYLIVSACIDRFALCSTNATLRQFSRVQVARRCVIPFIIIIWHVFPIYMLVFNSAVNTSCVYPGVSALVNSIYGMSLVGFLPPTLMLIFSTLTIRNLTSRQDRRHVHPLSIVNINVSTDRDRKQQKKDQQVFAMLIVQVIVYVITTSMGSINLVYSVATAYMGIEKSIERKAIESFISSVTGILNYTSPSLSFYLFLLVSSLYRKEMKLVIRQVCTRCGLRWIVNNNSVGNSRATHHSRLGEFTRQPTVIPLPVISTHTRD
ncbi:unnamed protein product [Rotaria sp. Silwood1]|nr:unnamed protein product [Rotaria sp. Silwood1]CAF3783322.1 unnamed protein product [Rotaria sp. Silwood1]